MDTEELNKMVELQEVLRDATQRAATLYNQRVKEAGHTRREYEWFGTEEADSYEIDIYKKVVEIRGSENWRGGVDHFDCKIPFDCLADETWEKATRKSAMDFIQKKKEEEEAAIQKERERKEGRRRVLRGELAKLDEELDE
ncbi:hypothetical protein [Defluviimonas salinarum]|uniref:Uncharacterized protein n=1 Tax=Defluviimonas salinarum TaxID=2992147 RepID=A0ABT3J7C8_9RHOB|nr:hypothetical protein [Defluviimonas salinarum]MCW3783592.1 hypothetical protein [Defluviimonas salinarum]